MDPITIPTSPTAVTVFPDRARVTRSGRAALDAGSHRLEIHDLPLGLLPDSLRASGRGTARARLTGVSLRTEHFAETPAEVVRDLLSRIQSAEDADADLAARSGVLEKERGHLEGLAAESEMFARGLALRNRTPDEQAAIFAFVRERSQEIQSGVLRLARERRELGKELDRLRRELSEVQSARPKRRLVASVELEVTRAGDLDLDLTYVVTDARWEPVYDLRLTDAGMQVRYLAQVAQRTGEDWPAVSLSLSTAQPALSLILPELDPWYIQPAPPPRPIAMKRAMPMAAAPSPATLSTAGAAPEPEAMVVESAAVSEAGASLTYRLSGSADVPGNGEPRKVTVAEFPLRPELDYVTAPKLADACYRRARLKNESPYSLLPGAAQLFDGDDYLGATALEFTAPGQAFELVLGADERLRVKRELVAREVDKAFLGDRRRVRYAYSIEVENLRDGPQSVLVRDQLPVSRDEAIKVRLESSEPKPAEHAELNLLEWKLRLDPSSKQVVRFGFSVEHPRGMAIEGLP